MSDPAGDLRFAERTMHDFSITLLHPFANFQFFNQWNGYISVVILKDYLARYGFEAAVVDLSSILSDYLFDPWYVEKRREALSREIDSVERSLEIEDTRYYLRVVFLAYLLQGSVKEKEPHEMMRHFFKKDPKLYQLFVQPLDVSAFEDVGTEDVQSSNGVKFFESMLMRVLTRIPPASVFGITVPSKLHLNSSITLSRLLRASYPSSHICLGGPYISLVDKRRLKAFVESGVIDTYITEDGEGKFVHLLRQLDSQDLPSVKGLFEEGHHPSVDELVRTTETPDEARLKLVLSKGCYWGKCAYCDYRNLYKKLSIKRVDILADEMASFAGRGHKDFLLMTDGIPPLYAKRIAHELLNRDLRVTWGSRFLRIDSDYDRDLFVLLKESGFDFGLGSLGMDSYSDYALGLVRKGYDTRKIVSFFEAAKEAEVVFGKLNLIYDLPGTSYRDSLDTIRFLERFIDQYARLSVYYFKLTPTSEMGSRPESFGLKTDFRTTSSRTYNSVSFEDGNGLDPAQREEILRSLRFIKNTLLIHNHYPQADKETLVSNKRYSRGAYFSVLTRSEHHEMQLHSRSRPRVLAPTVCSFPEGFMPDTLYLKYHRGLSNLAPRTWYTLEEIFDQFEYSSLHERPVSLQDIYGVLRGLLAKGFFADFIYEPGEVASQQGVMSKQEMTEDTRDIRRTFAMGTQGVYSSAEKALRRNHIWGKK